MFCLLGVEVLEGAGGSWGYNTKNLRMRPMHEHWSGCRMEVSGGSAGQHGHLYTATLNDKSRSIDEHDCMCEAAVVYAGVALGPTSPLP